MGAQEPRLRFPTLAQLTLLDSSFGCPPSPAMLRLSVKRAAGGGGIVDKMIPGYQEKIWAALSAGYKSYKVNSENSAFESHVGNHMRLQKLMLWWRSSFDGMKPSAKYRVNKVPW